MLGLDRIQDFMGMRLVDFDSLVYNHDKIDCYNHLLPENRVVSIQGTKDQLWVVYRRGLVSINSNSLETQDFGHKDGLNMEILEEELIHSFLDSDRDLYMVGTSSLTRFCTHERQFNNYVPPIVFTDFKIFNETVSIGDSIKGKPILTRAIHDTEALELPPGISFTLEFAALDYINPGMTRYRYKMEGIDGNWSPRDFNRTVTYAKLSLGAYTFRVAASNSDGSWNNEGRNLNILIHPHWWQTWWAYALYALGVGCLVLLLRNYERKQFILKQKAKSLEVIDKAKNEFFANISHELRTPLTLITGPLKALREGNYKGDTASLLDMMSRNGDRILRLVNQLLDLSKLDRGKMRLQCMRCDMIELLKSVVSSFDSIASLKGIDLAFDGSKGVYSEIDGEKISQVFFNLISNAIKFTPEGGQIRISVSSDQPSPAGRQQQSGWVKIVVKDSGIGIEKQDLGHIFDRFYQVRNVQQDGSEGTGIGLALAQKLVHLHRGTIEVESEPGVGSTFTVKLPLIQHGNAPQQVIDDVEELIVHPEMKPEIDMVTPDESNHTQDQVLMIVEDNSQMRQYIRLCLGEDFQYLEAADGEQALELAHKRLPDLILCDVMMPRMDGYEFCKNVRGQNATSHIPFIFLTAKADQDSLLKGLEMGSNDYLTKPFDEAELKLKVRNHLDKMQRYRTFFSKQLTIRGDIKPVESLDEKFLEQAIKAVEDQLDNHEFTVQEFSRKLGLSHTQLYRKLLALSGLSPNAFIRSIRLKRAAQLIVQDFGNTSEVAYAVGFNNLSYFTKCFKQQFGVVPSAYRKKNRYPTSRLS